MTWIAKFLVDDEVAGNAESHGLLPLSIVALLGEVSQSEFCVCANVPTAVETGGRDVRDREVPGQQQLVDGGDRMIDRSSRMY